MQGLVNTFWVPGPSSSTPTEVAQQGRNVTQGGPGTRRLERPEIPQERVSVPVEKLPSARERETSSIELMWQIPKDPVTGYRINYGYSRTMLDKTKEVNASSIEKFKDSVHGDVYRLFIEDVPADRSTFVSITAIEGGKESAPSAPVEVRPGTTEVKPPRPALMGAQG